MHWRKERQDFPLHVYNNSASGTESQIPGWYYKGILNQNKPIGRIKNSDLELMVEVLTIRVIIGSTTMIRRKDVDTLCEKILVVILMNMIESSTNYYTSGRILQAITFEPSTRYSVLC